MRWGEWWWCHQAISHKRIWNSTSHGFPAPMISHCFSKSLLVVQEGLQSEIHIIPVCYTKWAILVVILETSTTPSPTNYSKSPILLCTSICLQIPDSLWLAPQVFYFEQCLFWLCLLFIRNWQNNLYTFDTQIPMLPYIYTIYTIVHLISKLSILFCLQHQLHSCFYLPPF